MSEGEALAQSRLVDVRPVPATRPLHWLALGWRDLVCGPGAALLHGVLLAAFGLALLAIAHDRFWLLAGAFSGFLLVAPVLATGLYAISRTLESGARASLATAFDAWRPRDGRLVAFGLLLALAGTGWVLTSAALITSFAAEPVRNPADFMRIVVLHEHSALFPTWLALGGVLAAPMFASSVIAIPLLLDRRIGVLAAVLTSWRAVLANPLPLALWALLIMLLTLAGMAALMLGLVVVVPWLGHASWHAYRDLVDARHLPAAD